MKSYALIFVFSFILSTPVFGDYTEVKSTLKSLMVEADYSIEINRNKQDYDFWFKSGFKSGLKSSMIVINMWERHYIPYIPAPRKLQEDLSVLVAMSSQIIYEGFDTPEESWFQQGVSNSLSTAVLLLEHVNIN